jgi:hypothetical protein
MLATRAAAMAAQYAMPEVTRTIPKTMGDMSVMVYLFEKWRLSLQARFRDTAPHTLAETAINYLKNDTRDVGNYATRIAERLRAAYPEDTDDLADLATRFNNRGQMVALAQHEFKKAYTDHGGLCVVEGHLWRLFETLFPETVAGDVDILPLQPAPAPVAEADSSDSESDSSDSDSESESEDDTPPPPAPRRRVVVRRA